MEKVSPRQLSHTVLAFSFSILSSLTTTTHRNHSQIAKDPKAKLSFQEIISEIAGEDDARQKDVTLPFYFICLLHLANEHVSVWLVNFLVPLFSGKYCSEADLISPFFRR